MRKVLALLLSVVMTLTLLVSSAWADEPKPLNGKTVILHTNDVHGSIELYAKVAAMKGDYEAQGAQVILADAGDYSQGTVYVSLEKGKNAVTMMNLAGYDVATIGNHEFDYGYDQLNTNLKSAAFKVVCANVLKDGNPVFDAYTMINKGGVQVAFVGVETPEAQTKANPALIQGLTFLAGNEMYAAVQAQVDAAKTAGADIVIVLAHLGVDSSSEPNTSYDLYKKVNGIDFIIDGHSHTVMTKGPEDEPIQSTGTALNNIGVITIDNATKKIKSSELIQSIDYTDKKVAVEAAAYEIIERIEQEYGAVFAKTEVDLNGAKAPGNRTEETNLGDLITDAMMWAIKTKAPGVDMTNAVAITNGGGIRAAIAKGDITKKDVNTVLPFGNTLAVVYVKGSELLEALEVSTYCTPKSLGGFPQFAGMEVELNTACEYDANDTTYPGSTYFGPKSINRITIKTVNGKAFDKDATYAVITNDFLAAGGDTYYAFAAAQTQFDTGLPLDEILMEYITVELNGVVTDKYAAPQGRLTIVNNPPVPGQPGSPATGDTGVVIYMGLAILALTGGAFVARKKERF